MTSPPETQRDPDTAVGIIGIFDLAILSLTLCHSSGMILPGRGRGFQMRLCRIFLLGAAFLLLSRHAFADAIAVDELIRGHNTLVVLNPAKYGSELTDPRVSIRQLQRGSTPFYGLDFSFNLSDGTDQADFRNAGPATLYGLTFTITPGGGAGEGSEVFSCGVATDLAAPIPFNNCLFMHVGGPDSPSIVRFYGGPGLPSQSHFSVELDGFASNVGVSAVASPTSAVPEPGTLALFLGGVALLLGRRRSLKSRNV